MERSRGRHRQHAHHLPGHGALAEHDPLLPGRGDQRGGHERLVERRRRDHRRSHRSGRAHGAQCDPERPQGKHRAPPHLDSSGLERRESDHRLPHREGRQQRRPLENPRVQHRHRRLHQVHLHRPRSQPQHNLVLSRARAQRPGAGGPLERGRRHHPRSTSRTAAERARARGRAGQHPPRLGCAGGHRRGARHRLCHPADRAQRQLVDHPPLQHGDDGDHIHGQGTGAGEPIPVPGGGDQQRGTRRLVVRGEHEHLRPASRRTDRAYGPGDRDLAHRPVVDCAPEHRRRPHPRLPDRRLRRRGQHLADRPPQHQFDGDDVLRREPPARNHPALPRRGDQPRGDRAVLEHRARDHRGDRAGHAPEPRRRGRRHLAHRAFLASAHERRRLAHHRLPHRGLRGRGHPLESPREQLAQHAHQLRAHGAGAGHHAPLPRLGDQPGGRGPGVAGGERHDRRDRARRAHRADGHRGHGHADRPVLARARLRWRRRRHRLPHRGLGERHRVVGSGDQHSVQGHRVLAHRPVAGEQAPLPRLGDQPGGSWRAVGARIGRDRRPRRTGGSTQHARAAARGRRDDLEHRLGHRPPRRRGGQRDGHAAARGDERALVDGREPVRAGRGRPRPRAGRPGRLGRPLRRHLLHDALRRLRRAAAVCHGHAVGELGLRRVPPPRRTGPEHPRLEGQHGERPRRHRRARGARHPGGCRGLVQLGQPSTSPTRRAPAR